MLHGMGEAVQEAGERWLWCWIRRRRRSRLGEIISTRKHALTGAHQGSAERTGPEQLLSQQRCAGECRENTEHQGYQITINQYKSDQYSH